jgi:pyruvate formate lyase activating enzyme
MASSSRSSSEWIYGFDISGGNPDQTDALLRVLSYLKENRLKIQLFTDGRNAGVLERIVAQRVGDRMVMEIKGPAALYAALTGEEIDAHELERSIRLTATFDDHQFYTIIPPVRRSDGQISFLSPDEVGLTAQMIESAAQNKKAPYVLQSFDPANSMDEFPASVEAPSGSDMFKYRTAARRYQVMTEIKK